MVERKQNWIKIATVIISILLAFLVGSIIIISEGKNPLDAYIHLFRGAFGTITSLGETIAKSTSLIFTGLAATFAYRCGMFNLGGEGQFIMGAVAAAWVSQFLPANAGVLGTFLCLAAGILLGALWGAIPGLLKTMRNINEMIVSIFLNYIATLFMEYLFTGPMKEPNIPQTAPVPESMKLFRFLGGSRAHIGFFIALLVALAVWFFLFRTYRGFSLRAVGSNPRAAGVSGYNVKRIIVFAFMISGAIAGLGGATELIGISYRLQPGFAQGFGFDGVAVALIGQLHPVGVVLIGILFAALKTGTNAMQIVTGIPTSVVDIIQATIIIFAIASSAITMLPKFQYFINKIGRKKE